MMKTEFQKNGVIEIVTAFGDAGESEAGSDGSYDDGAHGQKLRRDFKAGRASKVMDKPWWYRRDVLEQDLF